VSYSDLKKRLSQSEWIVCSEALRILEQEEEVCDHKHYDMVAHYDDSIVGGTGWVWSPKCTDCGDDVPMANLPEGASENPTAFCSDA
jgi:hypothetical protein